MTTTENTVLSYSNHTVDITKIPAASLHRLASYGLAHYLGNQASSKVSAWADKDENKNATDEQKSAQKAIFQTAMLAAIHDGTMGQHASRGPSVDPVEAEMDRLAKIEVTNILKANNIKVPKKDEEVVFADGSKKSMDAMVDTRVEREGDRLRKEAEASIKAKAKAKAAAQNKVAGAGAEALL